MKRIIKFLLNRRADAVVENIIILPLIFIVIFAFIMTAFIMHDRSTLEAAARRGVIYASHCISNPNYAGILNSSGSEKGALDTSVKGQDFNFTGIGGNIQPYRYITGGKNYQSEVIDEVKKIVDKTRVPWRELEVGDITYTQKNHFFYETVSVTIAARYPLPKIFGTFGLDTEYEYEVSATTTVNDPDEFIRNADLVVDIIVKLDETLLGGKFGKTVEKIEILASKVVDWLNVNK